MKITLSLLLITLTITSGNPLMIAQQPLPTVKYSPIVDTLKIENDSNKVKYFKEVKKTEILTNQLIEKSNKLKQNNLQLNIEIKRLKKVNDFLRRNIYTIYVHDTIFKKRKILQLFKT